MVRRLLTIGLGSLFMIFTSISWAHAGRITLQVKSHVKTNNRIIDARFVIHNRGNEAAKDVSIEGALLADKQTAWVKRKIAPGSQGMANLTFELPVGSKGAFPIFAKVHYRDRHRTRFSIAAIAVAMTTDMAFNSVTMTVKRIRESQGQFIRIHIKDHSHSLQEALVTCHFPNDLFIKKPSHWVFFQKGVAETIYLIQNMKGTKGSIYDVFITTEFKYQGKNHLIYSSLPIPIKGFNGDEAYFSMKWIPLAAGTCLLILIGIVLSMFSMKVRSYLSRLFRGYRRPHLLLDVIILIMIELFTLSYLSPHHLITDTIATGGDMASHYYTAQYLQSELLPHGRISGWSPGNYAGFPLLQFYFPFSFLLMIVLNGVMPLTVAFKWVTVLGGLLLPIAAYCMLRSFRLSFPTPSLGALLMLPFLFHEGHSMWGGNFLSTFAGEFSYSLSFALSFFFIGSFYRGCIENRGVIRNALLVSLMGFSHGYTLLFAGAMTLFLLITPFGFLKRVIYLLRVYALGFCLMAFWLIPLLAYSRYTIPFHSVWHIQSLNEILPRNLIPVAFIAGITGTGLLLRYVVCRQQETWKDLSTLAYLFFGLLISGIFYILAPLISVVDIRYIPFALVILCLIAALGLGKIGAFFQRWSLSWAYLLVLAGGILYWTHTGIHHVPHWAKWNYEGFEAKRGWPLFREINNILKGTFEDPRVIYEHSSEYEIFGSTRAFESLPLFSGRATLEGVYMQASISAPFVFYIQSEISKQKSTPFEQYLYGDMNFDRALRHLRMFNVRDVILVSEEAKANIGRNRDYEHRKTLGQIELWQVKDCDRGYVVPLRYEPFLCTNHDWKRVSYDWFIRDDLLDVHLAFVKNPTSDDKKWFKGIAHSLNDVTKIPIDTSGCSVRETIHKDEIIIETNCLHKPLLIKMSFHPNWKVQGADRIYSVSPSFMLLFPKKEKVRLYYGWGFWDILGFLITMTGILILLLKVSIHGRTFWDFMADRYNVSARVLNLKWNPSADVRKKILLFVLSGMFVATLILGVIIYNTQPRRIFNRAINQKDAEHFDDARRLFLSVLEQRPSTHIGLDSLYYVALCYMMEEEWEKALQTLKRLIGRYPHSLRYQEAYYNIGLCYFRMGKERKGIEYMRFLINRHRGSLWAGFARDRLKERGELEGS